MRSRSSQIFDELDRVEQERIVAANQPSQDPAEVAKAVAEAKAQA